MYNSIKFKGPQPVAGQIKYKSTISTMVIVAREEGVAALYKGLLPKVMRLGPGGAIMLLVYEHAYEYLSLRFLWNFVEFLTDLYTKKMKEFSWEARALLNQIKLH